MPSAISLKPMGHSHKPRGRRRVEPVPYVPPHDDMPAIVDYDAGVFFGESERELVAPGVEARVTCFAEHDDLVPMQVSAFRTREGDDE
jgi:hypothetical protein